MEEPFELHVWGPALGLASIDPECLAAVAYLTLSLAPTTRWRVVASSPSAVPTNSLPALYSPGTSSWVTGFSSIVSHLRSLHQDQLTPSPSASPSSSSSSAAPPLRDLDAHLSPSARADASAYAAYLRRSAAPLLAISLYASSANWVDATRPALSAALPLPLAWTEAPALRAAWVARAEAAGVDEALLALADDDGTDGDATTAAPPAPAAPASTTTKDAAGWIRVPKPRRAGDAAAAAALEQRKRRDAARAQLEGLAAGVLDVLQDLQGGKAFFLDEGGPTLLDCLAYGYLAPMLVPDLPRPWLRDLLRARYAGLCAFVDRVHALTQPEPTRGSAVDDRSPQCRNQHDAPLRVARRFASTTAQHLPLPRFLTGLLRSHPGSVLVAVAAAAGGLLAVAAGVWSVRGVVRRLADLLARSPLPTGPFGAPVQRWERPRTGLRGLGAAGALFGFVADVAASRGGLDVGGGGRFGGGWAVPLGGPSGPGQASPADVELEVDVGP